MKTSRAFWAIVLCGSLLLVAQAAFSGGGDDAIVFDHAVHKGEASCKQCHAATLADKGMVRLRPGHKECSECHEVDGECGMCHAKPEKAGELETRKRATNFLHGAPAAHQGDCAGCHGADIDKQPHQAGDHQTCGRCHQADIDKLRCGKCHRNLSRYSINKLRAFSHAADFAAEHGELARTSVRACTQCHREAYCNACHSKKADLKPSIKFPEAVHASFMHRGDWETLHRIEAKVDSGSCVRCHRSNECSACHDQRKVSGRAGAAGKRHPAGWVRPGNDNFHGDKARTQIATCAACHSSKGPGYCADCHAASSGRNPHPPGWNGKARGLKTSDRMCATCHGR
jgi:hypothetical protein